VATLTRQNGRVGDATTVRDHAHTCASPKRVWRCLADPFSFSRWVSGTSVIRRADPSWPAVGARLYHRFGPWPLRFPDHTTVLEAQPPWRLVLAANARPFGRVLAEVTLEPASTPEGAGTDVVLCERMRHGPARLLPYLGRRVQRARNHRSLAALVELAENTLPPPGS
jgi:uncharacterized protein YndB with AHSA1/START domain